MPTPEHHDYAAELPHPLELESHYDTPRLWVPPEHRDWKVDVPDYEPPGVTALKVKFLKYPDADPEWDFHPGHPYLEHYRRMKLIIGDDGPHSPHIGRTGLTGRGEWPYYGPNFTSDMIHLRQVDDTWYTLAVVRGGNKKIAFPGGKLERRDHPDGGTDHYSAFYDNSIRQQASRIGVQRETYEESGFLVPDDAPLTYEFHRLTLGPRTTDVAWAASDGWSYITKSAGLPSLDVIDDAGTLTAFWLPVTRELFGAGKGSIMHSTHGLMLQFVSNRNGIVLPNEWTNKQLDMIAYQLPPDAAKKFFNRALQPVLY